MRVSEAQKSSQAVITGGSNPFKSLQQSISIGMQDLPTIAQSAAFNSTIANEEASQAAKPQGLLETLKAMGSRLVSSLKKTPETPEQKLYNERISLIEQYAESPFERSLFLLAQMPSESNQGVVISNRWAQALSNKEDAVERDAAISLLKQFLNYNRLEAQEPLSPHAQIKLMHFAGILDEGKEALGRLYEAVLKGKPAQVNDFLPLMVRDFRELPTETQLTLIKTLGQMTNPNAVQVDSPEAKAFKAALKQLVVNFYTNPDLINETVMQELIQRQEKIRLGFLRMSPITEAYQSAVAETDLRYRVRLRQLKRQRQLLLKQADDDKQQRIDGTYDEIEKNLLSALSNWENTPVVEENIA